VEGKAGVMDIDAEVESEVEVEVLLFFDAASNASD
jgi:hypothetical protein